MCRRSKKEIIANDNFAKAEVGILNEYLSDGMAETLGGWSLMELALIMAIWPGQAVPQWIAFLVLAVITFPIPLIWKRRITHARLGYFRIHSKRWFTKISPAGRRLIGGEILWTMIITLSLANIWMVAQRYSPEGFHPARGQYDLPLMDDWFFIMFVGGTLSHLHRRWRFAKMLLLYGVSLAIFGCAGYFHIYPSWIVAPIGLSLLVFGLLQLRRFLREYPQPEAPDVP
jgi:hypothetical protein